MTSLAEILRLSGQDPKSLGIDEKVLYQAVHVAADGKVLKGKDAVKAAGVEKSMMVSPQSQQTGNYKIKFKAEPEYWLSQFITQDEEMMKLKDKVRKLMDLPYPVLIRGETGTGKELIAKALHGNRQGDFIDVNCGGFPEHLIESELFGHIKGAFTGADETKQGLFQAAAGGTLFLDEIGELPMLMQCKLLRVLQEGTVRKVGAVTNEKVSCRIVAATHCDLECMIANKRFREDLLWRINTFELQTKPLASRPGDIPLISKALGMELMPDIFIWESSNPISGNVRQLQQIVLRRKYQI